MAQVNETVMEDFEVGPFKKVEVLTAERVVVKEQCPTEPEPDPVPAARV